MEKNNLLDWTPGILTLHGIKKNTGLGNFRPKIQFAVAIEKKKKEKGKKEEMISVT